MTPPRSFRVEAVVLRHSDWGEADRLLTLYTRELGKVRAIAKGVRKVTSRKGGHLEPFTRVKLQLARGRDLLIVTQADMIEPYLPLREDLVKTGYAAYAAELLDRFVYEEETANPAVFRLLTETFARLVEYSDPWLPVRYFEMRLLDHLGFRPQLFSCANCEKEIKAENQFFSAEQGGVLCPQCGRVSPGARSVSVEALKYMRHFQRSSYTEAQRARPASDVQREIEDLIQYYLTYLLERELNTPKFIKRIKHEGGGGDE
jgi:DNA repair protein RecO (recombination protein O)